MSGTDEDMEAAANDLEKHLRNPYMAGKPHIGVLGAAPLTGPTGGEDAEASVEASEEAVDSDSPDPGDDPEWQFVPNRAVCSLVVDPVNGKPIEAVVRFALRIDEGCEQDIEGLDRSPAPERHPLGVRPLTEILGAIQQFEVRLTSGGPGRPVLGEVLRAGEPIPPARWDVSDNSAVHQLARLRITEESSKFLTYKDKQPEAHSITYEILIEQEITRDEGGLLHFKLKVINRTPWVPMSRPPDIKRLEDEDGNTTEGYATPEQALLDLFARNKKRPGVPPGYAPRLWRVEGWRTNPSGNQFGFLLDFSVSVRLESRTNPYGEAEAGSTINVIPARLPPLKDGVWAGEALFKDSAVFREQIPAMRPGGKMEDFLRRVGALPELSAVFLKDKQWPSFYRFQERSMEEIFAALRERTPDAVVISARTASGKTEAFLVPVLDYCLRHLEETGTKALIFYPTKALGNDQANRFIEVLYHLNRRLRERGARAVTLGILHGDVARDTPEREEDATDLPLACPVRAGTTEQCPGRLQPSGHYAVKCSVCGESLDFVFITSRRSIYSHPPDLLVTNPDTVTWDLLARPHHHSILGRPVWACNECLQTVVALGAKKNCEESTCRQTRGTMKEVRPGLPAILVFDEVHLVKGAFGINTSLFLSRLRAVLKKYAREYHEVSEHRVVLVASTATISNAREFARDFFDLPDERIAVVPRDDQERESFYAESRADGHTRWHLACLPYAYVGDSTVARAVLYLQERLLKGRPPTLVDTAGSLAIPGPTREAPLQVLTFVNNIRTSNNLIASARRGFSAEGLKVAADGHTTDFDRSMRADTERKFNRGETNVLFATSTLEVGVDFRQIDVVVPYGMPYSFNDYLQRIGRCGRSKDGLVVTVCQNWKPVDHYYFADLPQQLEDTTKAVEPVPITRQNVEAMKHHARCCVLDYLSAHDRAPEWLDDIRKLPLGPGGNVTSSELRGYVRDSLSIPTAWEGEVLQAVDEFIGELVEARGSRLQPVSYFEWFLNESNEIHQHTNLRSTDPQVLVEVIR
jgi:hypothetical protein